MSELNLNSIDGIVKLIFNGNKYIFWNKADIILPYVRSFLKEQFPDDYILSEFNKIDFVVLGQNLPVEVQSSGALNGNFCHSSFEQRIQKQIKQNITQYNKCWFFFDADYCRYLQFETSSNIKLNFDWFIEYIKKGSLQVFTIDYKGKIKHLLYDDLEFLEDFSNPDLEYRKSRVYFNVMHGYGYTSEEIREYRNTYKLSQDRGTFNNWTTKKEQPERIRKLGHVLYAMTTLKKIDDFLFRKHVNFGIKRHLIHIGVLKCEKGVCIIEDNFDILQFFPGYIKNKEFWDGIKNKKFKERLFINEVNCKKYKSNLSKFLLKDEK